MKFMHITLVSLLLLSSQFINAAINSHQGYQIDGKFIVAGSVGTTELHNSVKAIVNSVSNAYNNVQATGPAQAVFANEAGTLSTVPYAYNIFVGTSGNDGDSGAIRIGDPANNLGGTYIPLQQGTNDNAVYYDPVGNQLTYGAAPSGNLNVVDSNANCGVGEGALASLENGGGNTAFGVVALGLNTDGMLNTATGIYSLYANTQGWANTAQGALSLGSNETGYFNTATGAGSLFFNTEGVGNTASGCLSGLANISGNLNTAIGFYALYANEQGNLNTAIGFGALGSTSSDESTAVGGMALGSNTTGTYNTAIGSYALYSNYNGHYNTALGYGAGANLQYDYNICIGNAGDMNDVGIIRIGDADHQSYGTYISGIVNNSILGIDMVIDEDGRVGIAAPSSLRYKHDIITLSDDVPAKLQALNPVSFKYYATRDPKQATYYGLIAEEVANVIPEMVIWNNEGTPESVNYKQLSPLLLKGYQALNAEVNELKTRNSQLEATLKAIDGYDIPKLIERLIEVEAELALSKKP
jgi:trimeric autotransporter adhesin